MKGIPDAIFIIDVGYENIAVSEAVKLGIPVVGVVDSNNSLKGVDYVIPGNDDAIRSISLYAKGMADAILDSRESIAHLGGPENKDELNLMYQNLHLPGGGNFYVGTNTSPWGVRYWSSSEEGFNEAWCQDFNNGNQQQCNKDSYTQGTGYVRAIRAF